MSEPNDMANIDTIRAHTANGLMVNPKSVDLQDKAALPAEIARLRAMTAWQPISKAPKTRTMIVVKAFNVRVQQGALLYTSDPYCVWWDDGRWTRWGHTFEPTHWLPLPDAPIN